MRQLVGNRKSIRRLEHSRLFPIFACQPSLPWTDTTGVLLAQIHLWVHDFQFWCQSTQRSAQMRSRIRLARIPSLSLLFLLLSHEVEACSRDSRSYLSFILASSCGMASFEASFEPICLSLSSVRSFRYLNLSASLLSFRPRWVAFSSY